MTKYKTHRSELQRLFLRPGRLGLEGEFMLAKEIRFMNDRSIIAEPDLMAIMDDKVILYEFKLHDSHMSRIRAEEQLETAKDYLTQTGFRYDKVRCIYVPGDAKPREV